MELRAQAQTSRTFFVGVLHFNPVLLCIYLLNSLFFTEFVWFFSSKWWILGWRHVLRSYEECYKWHLPLLRNVCHRAWVGYVYDVLCYCTNTMQNDTTLRFDFRHHHHPLHLHLRHHPLPPHLLLQCPHLLHLPPPLHHLIPLHHLGHLVPLLLFLKPGSTVEG